MEIYCNYFDNEIKGNYNDDQLKKQDEKVIFEFLRDYDICPTLVSKGIAYRIFLSCIESQYQVYEQTAINIILMSGQ
jgi:hypothetical protein